MKIQIVLTCLLSCCIEGKMLELNIPTDNSIHSLESAAILRVRQSQFLFLERRQKLHQRCQEHLPQGRRGWGWERRFLALKINCLFRAPCGERVLWQHMQGGMVGQLQLKDLKTFFICRVKLLTTSNLLLVTFQLSLFVTLSNFVITTTVTVATEHLLEVDL